MTGRVLFVTGTDTDVGKTITTAALAAAIRTRAADRGLPCSIAVDKPTQTGTNPDEPGDVGEIGRLATIDSATEGVRLRRPMAPVAAAKREGRTLPNLHQHAARIRDLTHRYDHVLVEGAGGLLVHLDDAEKTIADLAARFADTGEIVVVCRSGLGTLNHTELTLEALHRRGLPIAGIVIGAWPHQPDPIALDNRAYLSALDVPLLAAIPEHAARLDPATFRAHAQSWFHQLPRLLGSAGVDLSHEDPG